MAPESFSGKSNSATFTINSFLSLCQIWEKAKKQLEQGWIHLLQIQKILIANVHIQTIYYEKLIEWFQYDGAMGVTQLIFTCSKSIIETIEKGIKYVQS